jgi:hypothetical protein
MLRALQAIAFTVTHDSIVLSDEFELTDVIVNQTACQGHPTLASCLT